MKPGYVYRARVRKIVDGDTIDVDLDLGFGVILEKQRLRLCGINAPETRGKEREQGLLSKRQVALALADKERYIFSADEAPECVVETFKVKKGKYGRWIAIVWFQPWLAGDRKGKRWANLNKILVKSGFAKAVKY